MGFQYYSRRWDAERCQMRIKWQNGFVAAVVCAIILANLYLGVVVWRKIVDSFQRVADDDESYNDDSVIESNNGRGSGASNDGPSLKSSIGISRTGKTTIRVYVSESTSQRFSEYKQSILTATTAKMNEENGTISITLPPTTTVSTDDLNNRVPSISTRISTGETLLPDSLGAQVDTRAQTTRIAVSYRRPEQNRYRIRGGRHRHRHHHHKSHRKSGSENGLPVIRVTAAELRRLASSVAIHRPIQIMKEEPWEKLSATPSTITTFVTALLDIGRERWPHYGRPFFKYHDFMRNVLKLRMPLVVFVDRRSVEFVREERAANGLLHLTRIYDIRVDDLPLRVYAPLMRQIINYELNGGGWRTDWDPAMRSHPECFNADYDLVVNSKPYFLHNASVENPFESKNFVWLDGGYGHGDAGYFPSNFVWKPAVRPGRMSVIKLTPQTDRIEKYELDSLYRHDIAVVSGGFLAGDAPTIARFYHSYRAKFAELLIHYRSVDDDQTILVLLINEMPELFHVVHGDWFDAFRLF